MKKKLKVVFKTQLYFLIFILVPFVAFTLLASKTTLIPGIQAFVVMTGSMEPTLPVGTLIYIQKQSGYKVGDIISFKNESGQTVTHRIVALKDSKFVTKGDANMTADKLPISSSSVIGKSVFSIPFIGKFMTYLKTPFGFISILISPILIFVLLEFMNMKKEFEKEVEKRVLARMQG